MKTNFLFALLALVLPVLPVTAQLSPSLDPSFPIASIYQPSPSQGAFQFSSGARVVVGYFDKAECQTYSAGGLHLVRYQPSGAPDSAFNATFATNTLQVNALAEATNGKLLLGLDAGGIVGGQSTPALVQLNADGTRDAAFASLGSTGYVSRVLVQPNGKILVGGSLDFLGQTPAPGLARLNADGTLDLSFQAQLSSGRITGVSGLALQADGKLLVSAYVELPGAAAGEYRLVRLLANGTQDLTFQPVLSPGVFLSDVAVQPDGQVLVASFGGPPIVPGGTALLARFSATGVPDASFAPSSSLVVLRGMLLPLLAVQSDGRILVGHFPSSAVPAGHTPVARLLPSGAYDPAWNTPQVQLDAISTMIRSLQLLPTGQVLVGGTLARLGATFDVERGAALLDATGQPSGSFRPLLQQNSQVRDVAQQPDGRLVAVGSFSEVNGRAVRGTVRFQLGGDVDTAFCRQARLLGGGATRVLVQPDGTLLVGGSFTQVGSTAQTAVARLLPSGQADATFSSPLTNNSNVTELVRQPDGRLLLAGTLRRTGIAVAASFLRLSANGAIDATFQPPANVSPTVLLVQPDGRIVVGSPAAGRQVQRLLPDGSTDPAFTVPVLGAPGSGTATVSALALQPDGRLLIAGAFSQVGTLPTGHVARLLLDGLPDATFAPQVPVLQASGRATALALQPNGRILLAGIPQLLSPATAPSLYRLLPDGSYDASFDPARGPNRGSQLVGTTCVLVQADGAIVAAGGFTAVNGLPVLSLTRLLDSNVLATRPSAATSPMQVWPVPTHGLLHLSLEAAAHPRRVRVLNMAGQEVRAQDARTNELVLDLANLAPGLYVVRVDYQNAPPAFRRVTVE